MQIISAHSDFLYNIKYKYHDFFFTLLRFIKNKKSPELISIIIDINSTYPLEDGKMKQIIRMKHGYSHIACGFITIKEQL